MDNQLKSFNPSYSLIINKLKHRKSFKNDSILQENNESFLKDFSSSNLLISKKSERLKHFEANSFLD